jgi:glutathione-regulated potassium-efflux system ancillary protein KefC/glutathione-regulated potassium-efflux system protein KefB
MSLLSQTAIFLAAAVIMVPLFRRLKLGAVLGYLTAGLVIGPWGLRLVTEVESILHFAELGVVLLLFIIGLELQPSRLWVLRRSVFGLGAVQVAATAAVFGAVAWGVGLSPAAALVLGIGLSMNSTAFVLQALAERRELTARHGRAAFSISLFQDLAVIPMLAVIPLLAKGESAFNASAWLAVAQALAVIIAVVAGGRYLLRPVLRVIAGSQIQEIFTGAALLVVLGTALLMHQVGLSMTLGAFLAGVLLADSEYRHEIEASLDPFKSLLLGLFFIAVGMSANLGLLASHPLQILGLTLALMLVKAALLYAIGRFAGFGGASARNLAAALSHAGEFAFVLFALALQSRLMDGELVDLMVIVVTLSMMLTPLTFVVNDALGRWLEPAPPVRYDSMEDAAEVPVIIAGFGRVGQIVGRLLNARRIPFTALDASADQVETVRRFGRTAYYGDASRLDLLRAAKAERAQLLVVAIDDVEASIRTVQTARAHFPHLRIFARARNRFHAHRLMDLNVEMIERETFLGSLDLARNVLEALGTPAADAALAVARFRAHDERTLRRQHAIYHDEKQLIQTAKDAAAELESVFESDRESSPADGKPVFTPGDVR